MNHQSTRISHIKYKDESLTIKYHLNVGDITLQSDESPHPDFVNAYKKLSGLWCSWTNIPATKENPITPYQLDLREDNDGNEFFFIHAMRSIRKGSAKHNIRTTNFFEPEYIDKQKAMSIPEQRAIAEIVKEARAFLDGKREQATLFPPESGDPSALATLDGRPSPSDDEAVSPDEEDEGEEEEEAEEALALTGTDDSGPAPSEKPGKAPTTSEKIKGRIGRPAPGSEQGAEMSPQGSKMDEGADSTENESFKQETPAEVLSMAFGELPDPSGKTKRFDFYGSASRSLIDRRNELINLSGPLAGMIKAGNKTPELAFQREWFIKHFRNLINTAYALARDINWWIKDYGVAPWTKSDDKKLSTIKNRIKDIEEFEDLIGKSGILEGMKYERPEGLSDIIPF